jgi:hypothetical protein
VIVALDGTVELGLPSSAYPRGKRVLERLAPRHRTGQSIDLAKQRSIDRHRYLILAAGMVRWIIRPSVRLQARGIDLDRAFVANPRRVAITCSAFLVSLAGATGVAMLISSTAWTLRAWMDEVFSKAVRVPPLEPEGSPSGFQHSRSINSCGAPNN